LCNSVKPIQNDISVNFATVVPSIAAAKQLAPFVFPLLLVSVSVQLPLLLSYQSLFQVLCRVVSSGMITDKQWLFDHFIVDYSRFLEHHVVHIRKVGALLYFQFIVPHLSCLCMDPNWGVRKAVCEVFVEVARHTSPNVRRVQLAQTFVKLLHDPSRWVWYTAFQELGPFIATFANSKLSGLKIMDGQVYICLMSFQVCESNDYSDFEDLPAGCCMPEIDAEEEEMENSGQELKSRDNDEQYVPLFICHASDSLRVFFFSTPFNLQVTWYCSDLPLCFQQKFGVISSEDEDSYCGNRISIAAKFKYSLLWKNRNLRVCLKEYYLFPTPFSKTMFTSYSFSDELVEFGSSISVPYAHSFLERRFDLLYVSPERSCTSTASPHRTRSSMTSSEGDDLCSQVDHGEFLVDCTSEDDHSLDGSFEEQAVQRIVPQELVDNFMGMVLPSGKVDSDINRHCAHNFPAVAYTLGRANWPQLRDTYNKLVTDDQVRTDLECIPVKKIADVLGCSEIGVDFNGFFFRMMYYYVSLQSYFMWICWV
uniref:Non-specific serine/threonine protein kinase n=1 Tax=Angiostrongylus cantonensis TaxID=6313 RepID=A0A158PBD3_ANGCA